MNPNAHLYRTLTWPEVREAAERKAVIVIPVAAIEQHGYHLPIDTDNVLVEHVTEEAARRSGGTLLTAPMIHYGFNEQRRSKEERKVKKRKKKKKQEQ